MTSAKIRIKVGSMELEYEGDPSFLTGGIEALLTTMGDLSGRVPHAADENDEAVVFQGARVNGTVTLPTQVSTNTLAAHLEAKTCTELVVCALAQLELLQGKPPATRNEIAEEMKSATSYYNSNMRGGNLTQAFKTLVKNKCVNQLPGDKYALTANERKRIEAKVAEIG